MADPAVTIPPPTDVELGPTCEIHPGDRNHPRTAVSQRVITLIGEVHVPDLNVHGVGPNPVPVARQVL